MELSLNNLEEIYQMLKKAQNDAETVLSHFDLNESIEPTPEKRQLLNVLFERTSSHLMEVSHVDSFLQSCGAHEITVLRPEQRALLIQCQSLCQSLKASSRELLGWIVKMKNMLNEASCPVQLTEDEINGNAQEVRPPTLETSGKVSADMLQTYDKTRDILKEIHSELIFLEPEDMTNTAGKRLNVMEGKKLFLETEHEMNVFMDYSIFQCHRNGRNTVQRYYDLRSSLYTGEKLAVLAAFKDSRFSFLNVVRAVDEHGVVVNDPLTGEELLMIDRGLHQLVKKDKNYAVLTHYLRLPEFVMTTGAATPVPLGSEAEKEMRAVFNKLVLHHQKEQLLDEKSYKQCVTDLYKTAIHSDATKIVTSRGLPMNYHQFDH